jgi:hypothetical protein
LAEEQKRIIAADTKRSSVISVEVVANIVVEEKWPEWPD